MSPAILRRLRAMDGAELRFRAAAALRTRVDRARVAIAPSTWRREQLRLSQVAPADARRALARGDWHAAHRALAAHFAQRDGRFPLDPRRLAAVSAAVAVHFPENTAAERADRIVAGRYDLLGYRDVPAGSPPDWHTDPVHVRRAPRIFWEAVPYLDPAWGDHKVTWEINRHQHFLALGRAHALTGNDRYYQTFVSHLSDWIRENPPLIGTNWASMLELAFRCLSWLWALHFFARCASTHDAEPWVVDLLLALDRQLTHVEQNLSRYFSPNTHLTGEALALYVAGRALPELARSSARGRIGGDVLGKEAYRQVLPDGAHAELSAHYHRYSTDFYLLACHVARITGDDRLSTYEAAALRQAAFLRALADETGRLPLIGDDDGGQLFPICGRGPADAADTLATAAVLLNRPELAVGAHPEETFWACASVMDIPVSTVAAPPASRAFEHSGYCICRDTAGHHLVFDCGRHGYLNGGHAHADALSVVASVRGVPLLVDPGTATYTMNPEVRDRYRSTAMHNTVVVNGRSQSEPRGPFHWISRTDAECTHWQPGPRGDYAEGQHEAYAPVRHVRVVFALHGMGWVIVDHLLDGVEAEASAMWHLHPEWTLHAAGDDRVVLHRGDASAVLASSVPVRGVAQRTLNEYAPEYGRIQPALCLCTRQQAATPFSIATFVSTARAWQACSVTELPVTQSPGRGWHGAAFRAVMEAGALLVFSSAPIGDARISKHPWGTDDFTTSARGAVVLLTSAGTDELIHADDAPLASSMHDAGRR